MTRLVVGLAMGAVLVAACDSGHPEGTATNGGSGSATATSGGSTAGPLEAGAVTTLAGQGGQPPGYVDGPGLGDGGAKFYRPVAVALDSKGSYFIADTGNNCIRQIDPSANVTTVASSLAVSGPSGVAVDSAGDLIVAGGRDFHIWKLPPDGTLQILAGGLANQSAYINGAGGQSGPARFKAPAGVALDAQGDVYVADWDYVRKIDTNENVTTVAGVEASDGQKLVDGSGGESGTAQFFQPHGLAVDAAGNIFVADTANNAIRKIDSSGNVTTVAGTGQTGFVDGKGGITGAALFNRPTGVAVDSSGNLFVADSGNNVVRRIDTAGLVSTWAGTGASSYGDASSPLEASFANPLGLALRPGDGLVVVDQINNCIRLIAP